MLEVHRERKKRYQISDRLSTIPRVDEGIAINVSFLVLQRHT